MKKQHKNAAVIDVPDYKTLKEIIVHGTEMGGDKKMLVYLDKIKAEHTKTYNYEWKDMSEMATCYYLDDLTGKKKIAIISENCYEWICGYYASLISGNISVPMDCKLPEEDLEDQLIRCECDALIYSDKYAAMVEKFKQNPAMTVKVYYCTSDFDEYLKKGRDERAKGNTAAVDAEVKPDDLACIVYTSGTTGKSKGVMLTHYNVASNCASSCRIMSGKHAIGFLPLNHTYAWVSALFSTYIVTEWGYMCDSIKDIQGDFKKYKPYNFSAVPLVEHGRQLPVFLFLKPLFRVSVKEQGHLRQGLVGGFHAVFTAALLSVIKLGERGKPLGDPMGQLEQAFKYAQVIFRNEPAHFRIGKNFLHVLAYAPAHDLADLADAGSNAFGVGARHALRLAK